MASTATIGVRLVAVGTIVTELRVVRAVLPADWANSTEATLAVGVAEGTILLLIICAGGERLTSGTSIGFLPARVGDIRVVIIMMIVVNWCTIVVLFGMSQRLLRVMSEVRHVLLILIVGVAAFVLHGVLVVSVETTVVVGAIIEVLRVVVSVMMTMLHLVVSIVVIRVVMLSDVLRLVVVTIHGEVVVHVQVVILFTVVLLVHVLDIMIAVVEINVVLLVLMVLLLGLVLVVDLGGLGSAIMVRLSGLVVGVAKTLTVVSISWLVVATSIWVMSKVSAFAWSVVSHGLVIALIIQIIIPAISVVRCCLMVLHGGVDALILGVVAKVVTLELVLVILTVLSVTVRSVFTLVFALLVMLSWLTVLPLLTVDLSLIVVVLIVMGKRWTNLSWVSVVVGTLRDDIVLLWASHSEVKRLVVLIIVVVSVVLVTVHVFRGHVMVTGVLVVVRRGVVASLVRDLVVNWSSSVVHWGLVVDWSGMVDWGLVVDWSSMVDWSLMLGKSLVVSWSNMMRSIMMDWSNSMMNWSDSVMNWSFMVNWCSVMNWDRVVNWSLMLGKVLVVLQWSSVVNWSFMVHGSSVMRSFMMDWSSVVGGFVVHWCRVMDWDSMVWSLVMYGSGSVMNGSFVVHWSCLVVDRHLMMRLDTVVGSLVVSLCAMVSLGVRHVVRLAFLVHRDLSMMHELHLVMWVLHVMNWGVSLLFVMANMRLFNMVRLWCLVVHGSSVVHWCGVVRSLVVHWSRMMDGC